MRSDHSPERAHESAPISAGRRLLARAQRFKGPAIALSVRLAAAGIAYLLQIVLARTLGASEYGVFSFAWSLITMGGFLATIGFGQIAIRFLALYHEEDRPALARGFMRAGLGVTLLGSLLITAGLYALFPLLEAGYGALCCAVLAIGLLVLPLFALSDFMEGIARSQGWTLRALGPTYLIRQGGIVVMLLTTIGAGIAIDARLAMQVALIATGLAVIVQLVIVLRPFLAALPKTTPLYAWREWRRTAFPTLLTDFAVLARQNVDLILLGLLAPASAVGLYFAATRIASLLGLVEFAVGAAYGHRFARVKADEAAFIPLYREATLLTIVPGLLAALLLMLGAPLILGLFGPAFASALIPLEILLGASVIRLAIGPAEDALSMAGHPACAWRANAIGALVMAILCLLLARDFQANGAAIGAAGGILASTLVLALAIRREFGVWPIPFGRSARP